MADEDSIDIEVGQGDVEKQEAEAENEEYDSNSDEPNLSWTSLFYLPFQPIWWYSLLSLAVFQIYFSIYKAGFKRYRKTDVLIGSDYSEWQYFTSLLYLIDILLTFGSKSLHDLQISPSEIRRPNWILAADLVSIIPIELFIPMNPLTPFKARLYYVVQLISCFKIIRIYYIFYYNHNSVGTSKVYLQIFEYYFSTALACMIAFVMTYHIICYDSPCKDTLTFDDYFSYMYISVSKVTARGVANYPENLFWKFCISILVLYVFMTVICMSISYVAIALFTLFHHRYDYLKKLKLVYKRCKQLEIPKEITNLCIEYLDFYWKQRTGYDDNPDNFAVLPQSLYEEITLDIYWDALKHSQLLRTMDIPFLRHVSVFVKSKFFLPGYIVYDRHQTKNMMIYVVSGVIQILSEEDDDTPILSFSSGTCLGESSLVLNYRPKSTVRCKTYCTLHVIEAKDFFTLFKIFPKHFLKMRQDFRKRLRLSEKHHEMATLVNKNFGMEERTDHVTIMWMKTTLHRLMAKDGDDSSKHQCQNIFLREELSEEKFVNRYFSAKYLDMLAIAERMELINDTVFLKNSCPCVFQPDSVVLKTWEGIMVLLAIATAFVAPYYAFVEPSTPFGYRLWIGIVNLFWGLDIYVQISTAIKTTDEIIASVKRIFLHRMTTLPFLVDLFSTLPIEFLSSIILWDVSQQYKAVLYLNRVIKIWKVRAIFKNYENQLYADMILIQYFKYCCCLLYTIYFCACLLYAANCFNFVCIVQVTADNVMAQLLWCIVAVTHILSGVCLGSRLTAKNIYYPYYMVFKIFSTIFYIFVYGSLAAEYALKRTTRTRLSEKLKSLVTIIKVHGLSAKYNKRIFDLVNAQLEDNDAEVLIHTKSVFAGLPPHLLANIRESAHKEIFANVPIFNSLPDEVIGEICVLARLLTLPPNEVVCYAGDICDTIYVIEHGYCKVISGNRQSILGPKESLYAVEGSLRVPVVNTIVTITHCRMAVVNREHLNEVYAKHPVHKEEVENAFESVDMVNRLELLSRTSAFNTQYADMLQNEKKKTSFHKFSYNIQVDTFEEYDYYIPFDRLHFLSFVQYFLLRYTVLPESKFFIRWEICRCICAVFSAILFSINEIGTCSNCYWYYLLALLDGMAWIDIYLRLHVCYYNEDGVLVTHPLKTATYYLKHGFLVDFAGVFPVHLFFPTASRYQNEILALMQLNRSLQMHRYIGFLNYIERRSFLPMRALPIVKYFPVILVLCVVVGSASINTICDFSDGIGKDPTGNFQSGVRCKLQSWITKSDFRKPLSKRMVQTYAVYFATSVLTTVGMMGFKIQSTVYAVWGLLLSVAAYILSAHIACKAVGRYTVGNATLLVYQDAMKSIRCFMNNFKVQPDLQRRLIAHYELTWVRKRGRDIHHSISKFNRALQNDILYDIYGTVLQETSFFVKDNKAFLRNLLLEVSHYVVIKNSFIVSVNDVSKYIHIIYKGKACVIAPDGTKIATLTPGSMFGNLDNCDMTRQTVSIRSVSHVETLTIETLRFHAILGKYPYLQKRFKYLTAMHVDYVEGRGRVVLEDQLTYVLDSTVFSQASLLSFVTAARKKVFDPGNKFIQIWQKLILFVVCYYEVCFTVYQMALEDYAIVFVAFQYTCDVLYLINFFIKAHTAYENDVGGLITDLKMIREHLYPSRVAYCLEIISMVPLDVFAWFAPAPTFRILHPVLRLNRLIRFMHVIKSYIEKKEKLDLNLYFLRYSYLIIWSTFTLNLCTCLLITLGCIFSPNMVPEISCDAGLSSYDRLKVYLQFYYVVVSCFIHASQDSSYPDSFPLTIYCVFMMIFSQIMNALCLAHVYSTLQMGYHRQNSYAQRLEKLRIFMRREQLSESLFTRAYEYLKFLWRQQRGEAFPRLLLEAPQHLRESILNSAFAHHIDNHYVFMKCHVDFNRQLVACFRNKMYFKDDYIVLKGTINRSMYFIHTGEVVVLEENDLFEETVVEKLKPGMSFGVTQGLLRDRPYSYSFRSTRTTVILCLYLDTWKHLLRFFPASKAAIFQRYAEYGDKYA